MRRGFLFIFPIESTADPGKAAAALSLAEDRKINRQTHSHNPDQTKEKLHTDFLQLTRTTMGRDNLTIDQTVYGALKDDLINKHHVDMVFSYYNEKTAKVEFSKSCHRMALAAKSRLLYYLLSHGSFGDEILTLILVGSDNLGAAEDLINILYSPEKCGKDITLWDDAGIKLGKSENVMVIPEFESFIKMDDIKEETDHNNEDACVDQLYDEEVDPKGHVDYKEDSDWEFDLPDSNGIRSKRSCQKRNKKEPKKPKKKPHPKRSTDVDSQLRSTGMRISSNQRKQLEEANSKFDLTLEKVQNLLEQNSGSISLKSGQRKFDALTFNGCLIPYSQCKSCAKVIESKDVYAHGKLCKARKYLGHSTEVNMGQIEKLIREKDSDVAMDHRTRNLEKLIRYRGPDVSKEQRSSILGNFKKYFKYIIYKQAVIPFIYCRLCQNVIEDASAFKHECVQTTTEFANIFKNERSRVCILDTENVNPLYQFIFPVELDGKLTDFAYCQKCDTFLPKAVVMKADYDHRCLQLQVRFSVLS